MEGATHTFDTDDGHRLTGTLFEAEQPVGFVIVNSGTGIPRKFYRRYAAFLAGNGYSTLTYDYRDTGDSLHGPLKESSATMTHWGRHDISAAIAEARRLAPDLPRMVVAHSAGGQLMGMAHGHEHLAGVLAVAVSSGTWWRMDPPTKWQCIALWYLLMPVGTTALGYFPGSKFGLGEDLPSGVGREWGKWCCHPDYLGGFWSEEDQQRYHALDLPWHSLSFADDELATRANVTALRELFPNVRLTDEFLAPADLGMKAIGHMGFFKADSSATLWPKSLEALRGFHASNTTD